MYFRVDVDKCDQKIESLFELDIRNGDVLILRGEYPLNSATFRSLYMNYEKRKVDFIFETRGEGFHLDYNISKILKMRIRELRIYFYSADFPENDMKHRQSGYSIYTLYGIKALKEAGYNNISFVTSISKRDCNRIKYLLELMDHEGIKDLYIKIEKDTPLNNRVAIIRDLEKEFLGNKRIIIDNNGFEMRLTGRTDPVEIRSDPDSGTINLVIRNTCSSSCIYCTTRIVSCANNDPLPYDNKDKIISSIINETKKLKKPEILEIVAVEPFEHPHIKAILKETYNLGFKDVRILTHGRNLSDISFISALEKYGLRDVLIPITFYSPETAVENAGDEKHYHDIVRTLENIKNFKGIRSGFNIVISKANYQYIDKIYDFIRSYGFQNIVFSLALPSIEDERYFKPYAVKFSDILNVVQEISDSKLKEKIVLSIMSFIPACLIIKYMGSQWEQIMPEKLNERNPSSLASKSKSASPKTLIRCKKFNKCPHHNYCVGVNEIYMRVFGDNEFHP